MPPVDDDTGDATFSPQSGIAAVDRAVAVLDVFTRGQPRLGVSEIARAAGLSTSTAHRVLASLCLHGLVTKVGPNYRLGPRILHLAAAARDTGNLTAVARPLMTRLRDATGETVGLHVVKGSGRFVIDQVESTQPLRRTYTEWGQPIPWASSCSFGSRWRCLHRTMTPVGTSPAPSDRWAQPRRQPC